MIGIDVVIAEISGLKQQDLERWISNAWVRPDKSASGYAFREIDVCLLYTSTYVRLEHVARHVDERSTNWRTHTRRLACRVTRARTPSGTRIEN